MADIVANPAKFGGMGLSEDMKHVLIGFEFQGHETFFAIPIDQLPGLIQVAVQKSGELATKSPQEVPLQAFDTTSWSLSVAKDGYTVLGFDLPNGGRLGF